MQFMSSAQGTQLMGLYTGLHVDTYGQHFWPTRNLTLRLDQMSNIGCFNITLLMHETECNLLLGLPLTKATLPLNNNIMKSAERHRFIWSTFVQQVAKLAKRQPYI